MIWGGNRIASYKGIAVGRSDIGESWELSGVKGDESVVAEGEYAGMTLPELIGLLKWELVGHAVYERHGTEFPLLVKFIDARQDLSIQVHPNDVLARMRHGKNGKTEMWYVVAADRGAHLKSGFSEQLTPAEYQRKVADHTLTDALCDYSVAAGDLFFLPAGRVHAICAGTFRGGDTADFGRHVSYLRLRPYGGGRETARTAHRAGEGRYRLHRAARLSFPLCCGKKSGGALGIVSLFRNFALRSRSGICP